MIHVSILALRNAGLASIFDTRKLLSMVNGFLRESGKEPLFEAQLVARTKEVDFGNGVFTIRVDALTDQIDQTDLVIIPALEGDMMTATYLNKEYAQWIVQQYKNGAAVASLCAGAFMLAFTGLLKGKSCTTHWAYANEFRHFYPSVELLDEKTITDQNGLYSSGGCNAYWNLLLHLVEKHAGRETAIRTAKYFVIDLDRTAQSPFIIFNGLKDHDDDTMRNAQEYIEAHYRGKLTVDQLAARFNITRRTFERRFKKATRHTVFEYIQRVKIEATKKQLEIGRKTVVEIMESVGYTDIQTFRNIFKDITGMTPIEYRKKYNNTR